METLKVNYVRRASRKTGENFDTQEVGGEWEFSIQDGADVDSEYGKALFVLKSSVDGQFADLEVNDAPRDVPKEVINFEQKSRELQQRVFTKKEDAQPAKVGEYRTFASGSTGADIVEGEAVFLENVRVWEVKEDKNKFGKRFGYARVGNKENVPGTPTNYARVKSYEPSVINKIVALSEGDHVDIYGHYESWMGRESVQDEPSTYMWDFVPERILKHE